MLSTDSRSKDGLSGLFGLAALWIGAMAFHIYRAATFRPAFKHLGDTSVVLWSFLSLFLVTNSIHTVVLFDKSLSYALVSSLVGAAIYSFISPSGKSRSVKASLFMSASASHFLSFIYAMTGDFIPHVPLETFANLSEPILIAWTYWYAGHRADPVCVAKGYRPNKTIDV